MSFETHLVRNHNGNLLEVWLYEPFELNGPHPVIVMCGGVGSIKADGLPDFADIFCNAGYAVVLFDFDSFGGSEGQPRHTVVVGNQYQDYISVIDWAQRQTSLDQTRVVAWGTSFGGMHVTRLLEERYDIAAGIAQCPCVDALLASRMKPMTASLRLGFWAIADTLGSFLGMDPIYVAMAATTAADGVALMNGADVKGWSQLHPAPKDLSNPFYNRLTARSLLSFPSSRPGLSADQIGAPYLLIVPANDSIAPRDAAIRAAQQAPKGELVEVPGGHFDVYKGGIGFKLTINAQLEFLQRVVPVRMS